MMNNWQRNFGVLVIGLLVGSASTGYIANKYYERKLIDSNIISDSINIMSYVNVLNRLRLNKNEEAIFLLENDLDTNIVTTGMFENEISESILGNIKLSINAANKYRKKYPYTTDNEEWNRQVAKMLGKYE